MGGGGAVAAKSGHEGGDTRRWAQLGAKLSLVEVSSLSPGERSGIAHEGFASPPQVLLRGLPQAAGQWALGRQRKALPPGWTLGEGRAAGDIGTGRGRGQSIWILCVLFLNSQSCSSCSTAHVLGRVRST